MIKNLIVIPIFIALMVIWIPLRLLAKMFDGFASVPEMILDGIVDHYEKEDAKV